MEYQEIKEFSHLRVSKNLIKPETFLGVDIVGFVANVLIGLFVVIVCRIYWLAFFFIFVHFILRRICKKDGRIITIFLQRHLKEKKVFFKG